MTTTVNVGDLYQALTVVLPFAAKDGDPVMESVHIEAVPGGGGLVATASNRYVLGHIRILATGDNLDPVVLPRRSARLILSALVDAPSNLCAHLRRVPGLTPKDDRLEVATDRVTLSVPVLGVKYPNVIGLFQVKEGVSAGLAAPIDLNPRVTRPFAKAYAALGGELRAGQVRWTFHGDTAPVRIEIGERFAGLLMPRRISGSAVLAPVPIGLVEPTRPEPQPVPA